MAAMAGCFSILWLRIVNFLLCHCGISCSEEWCITISLTVCGLIWLKSWVIVLSQNSSFLSQELNGPVACRTARGELSTSMGLTTLDVWVAASECNSYGWTIFWQYGAISHKIYFVNNHEAVIGIEYIYSTMVFWHCFRVTVWGHKSAMTNRFRVSSFCKTYQHRHNMLVFPLRATETVVGVKLFPSVVLLMKTEVEWKTGVTLLHILPAWSHQLVNLHIILKNRMNSVESITNSSQWYWHIL